MQGDAPSVSDTVSIISSLSSGTSNLRIRKHIAVITTSSESEDESSDWDSSAAVGYKACSGDSAYNITDSKQVSDHEVKIKKSHCTVIPDLDADSDKSDIQFDVEVPKFSRQLDWYSWTKKKNEEMLRKKQEEEKAEQDAEIVTNDREYAKEMAWVNWMCKKKNIELQKKINDIDARRNDERQRVQKQIIAREKFEEWFKKKKHELKNGKQGSDKNCGEKNLKKKLTKCKKWEEWYDQKKTEKIPKSFTHINYPEPAWVNPVPWCHPEPSNYSPSIDSE